MRKGYFVQSGIRGHDREESLKILSRFLPSSVVFIRSDYGGPEDLESLIKSVRKIYRIENGIQDPYIAVDQEGGNVVRIPWINYNPSNAFLGHVDNTRFTEFVGLKTGHDLLESGIDWNLAPVLDLSNPYNQVILERSFGYDAQLAARHGVAFIRGLQKAGVAGTAKHFPGHGGVLKDSHLELPVDQREMPSLENDVFPFREAIKSGVRTVMMSHVLYSALDADLPASLSEAAYGLLRKYGFNGVAITDSLDMKAISKNYSPKEIAKLAFEGGADMLECADIDFAAEIAENIPDSGMAEKAERLAVLKPETKISYNPPDEVIWSMALLNSVERRRLEPLDPEAPTAVIYLDVARESIAANAYQDLGDTAESLRGNGINVETLSNENAGSSLAKYDQVIFVGRNEHLKQRAEEIAKMAAGKKAVFISSGMNADTGLISQNMQYISCFSTKRESLLGAFYRAFGFY